MSSNPDRLELCVTYVAPDITIGVRPGSIEFLDRNSAEARAVATVQGHIPLPPGVSFYMNTDEFGIGRSVHNDLYIDSPKISRSHVKILASQDESFHLQDVGSANGTSLNGQPLEKFKEYRLRESGEIQLAGIFHLKFTDFGATYVAPETLTIFGLSLSHTDRLVWAQGKEEDAFRLSSSEYKFLNLLMEKYPDPVSHTDIAQAIWEYVPDNPDDDKRSRDAIFNIAKRLRERLQMVDPDYEYIETVRKWGDRDGGYKFNKQ
ncbi:MAG: FHA domain-containing protein [Caldilineaceae bacterium]